MKRHYNYETGEMEWVETGRKKKVTKIPKGREEVNRDYYERTKEERKRKYSQAKEDSVEVLAELRAERGDQCEECGEGSPKCLNFYIPNKAFKSAFSPIPSILKGLQTADILDYLKSQRLWCLNCKAKAS